MPIGRRNRVLAQQRAAAAAAARAPQPKPEPAQQLAGSIAPPSEEFETPAKKTARKKTTKKKKKTKKDQWRW